MTTPPPRPPIRTTRGRVRTQESAFICGTAAGDALSNHAHHRHSHVTPLSRLASSRSASSHSRSPSPSSPSSSSSPAPAQAHPRCGKMLSLAYHDHCTCDARHIKPEIDTAASRCGHAVMAWRVLRAWAASQGGPRQAGRPPRLGRTARSAPLSDCGLRKSRREMRRTQDPR